MTVQQRFAWFTLAVLAAGLVVYGILVPLIGPQHALAAFGVLGLWGLQPLFYRRRKREVVMDERDQLIALRAQIVGFWIFWECFVAACMILWAVLHYGRHQETVPADVLPLLVGGGFVVFFATNAVATLLQYRRSRGHENG